MASRLSPLEISSVLQVAMRGGWIRPEDTAVIFLHTDFIHQRLRMISEAFPSHALHTVAVKAMPLPAVLTGIALAGYGAEVASYPELQLALRCGFPPHRIVFDSPAKTVSELESALQAGVNINADNFAELIRIEQLLGGEMPKGRIGLRINPQVGTGRIAATSTAGAWSKFGVPLEECRSEIIGSFRALPWLSGVHMHIGSQGISMDQLMHGAERLMSLVNEIRDAVAEENRPHQLRLLNIGGGLPAVYTDQDADITPQEYATRLASVIPILQDANLQLITEFGRWTFAGGGWTASRVEYVKHWGDRPTAIIHVGADLLLRDCYQPGVWNRECLAFTADGAPSTGRMGTWALAGPLCFSGDVPLPAVQLPALEPNDWVVLRDTGAYTFSMWSRYNSRQMPRILGWNSGALSVLKERETDQDVIDFWI